MVIIRKYTPAFVSGAEDITAVASSKESLMEIPFVKSWMRYDTFREFRISEKHLMVFLEEQDGEWLWFVVGTFQHGTEREAESWFEKADYSKYARNEKATQNRRDAEAGVMLEEYDASIKDLDPATRCSKCRFIVCRPGVGIDDPRYWTAPWTCGRHEGCIFDVNKNQH